ncbi:MAG: sodium:proton antiporter, partial [Legionellales bacterium]|nr:sodium:proton antiporter [Legionellales bacterium]
LLFAGSLHINTAELAEHKYIIFMLATVGVIISTLVTGFLIFYLSRLFNIYFPLIDCLTFGALISPTDPIAVLGALKNANAPKKLEIKIAGESLYNDGIGIVLFSIMLTFYTGSSTLSGYSILLLFIQQLGGGLVCGILLGYVTIGFLKGMNNLQVAILITLSLVSGGYLLVQQIGCSGPIAMVTSGLMVGSALRHGLIAKRTVQLLDGFWEMIDEVLTSLLFMLIGLELIRLQVSHAAIYSALFAIPIVLLARLVSVYAPLVWWGKYQEFKHRAVMIMTWGGLRGGISIALALSLPDGPVKDEIITITYSIVVFSILVQGLTVRKLIESSFG